MKTIAIEGIDGVGKTSVANEIGEICRAEQINYRIVAPYVIANERVGTNLYPLWKSLGGATMASDILVKITQEEIAKSNEDDIDLLIFDRHWMTAFTEIDATPSLTYVWRESMVPTALLKASVDVAKSRSSRDDLRFPWMEDRNMANYAEKYQKLYMHYYPCMLGCYRSEKEVKPIDIAENIMWDLRIRR